MKNKSIHIVSAILFCLLFSMSLFSQNSTTTLSLLKGKKWEMLFPSEKQYKVSEIYSNDTIIHTFTFNGTNVRSFELFYLSDSVDYNFNPSRIGQYQNGRYIITKNTINNEVFIYEIISISSGFVEFKNMANRELVIKYQAK